MAPSVEYHLASRDMPILDTDSPHDVPHPVYGVRNRSIICTAVFAFVGCALLLAVVPQSLTSTNSGLAQTADLEQDQALLNRATVGALASGTPAAPPGWGAAVVSSGAVPPGAPVPATPVPAVPPAAKSSMLDSSLLIKKPLRAQERETPPWDVAPISTASTSTTCSTAQQPDRRVPHYRASRVHPNGDKVKQEEYIGFGKIAPQYPLPYAHGWWPKEYDYSGKFPEHFIWGMGTAAFQVEGAYNLEGRGASIWDTFTGADTRGMPGANCSYCCKEAPCPINARMVDKGATGNVAADHYHMWRTDIALMKSMGLKHYRFSVSWSRLIPTGKLKEGKNQKGIDFYNNLINELIRSGITPYITLYHWDLPQGLLDPPGMMGWWARDAHGKPVGQILPHFLDFAELCFREFGDRVKVWFTFNEAWSFTFLASGWGKAPSISELSNMEVDPYIAGHNVLNAHAAAVHLYRTKFQNEQQGQIGITNNCDWREPKTADPQDVAAAERILEFQLGWFSDPIFGQEGDYPASMRMVYGKRLPEFSAEEKDLLRGSSDFFALNTYGTGWASFAKDAPGADLTYSLITHLGLGQAQSEWLFGAGWGFRKLLNWISRRYNHPPIYVTEGGWSIEAATAVLGGHDAARTLYYANYTAEMYKAIHEDKIDVRGYFGWSFLDNFEWEQGYRERFGIVFNDYALGFDAHAPTNNQMQPTQGNQTRRRKDSSCWLQALWTSNELTSPEPPHFQGCPSEDLLVGTYNDSALEGCLWKIQVHGDNGLVSVEGEACKVGVKALHATFSGTTIMADFTSVGRPSYLAGFWNGAAQAIEWGDGTRWTKVQHGAGIDM